MKQYDIRTLIAAYRFAKERGERGEFQIDWCTRLNGLEWLRWFRECLNAKINRGLARTGRKLDGDYQTELRRDARHINDYFGRRIRNSGCRNLLRTPELRRRYPQINNQEFEAI